MGLETPVRAGVETAEVNAVYPKIRLELLDAVGNSLGLKERISSDLTAALDFTMFVQYRLVIDDAVGLLHSRTAFTNRLISGRDQGSAAVCRPRLAHIGKVRLQP